MNPIITEDDYELRFIKLLNDYQTQQETLLRLYKDLQAEVYRAAELSGTPIPADIVKCYSIGNL